MKKKPYPELPILLVDDEESFLDSLKNNLRLFGKITNVECCEDSRDVMPLLAQKKFSLIILDILMPYIRGDELLPEIRGKYPDQKVILLTAISRESIKINPSNNRDVDYIMKPFDSQQLIAIIKEKLDEKNP